MTIRRLLIAATAALWLRLAYEVFGAAPPVDPLAGAESHFAASGTNRVHYLALGHGPKTILFVHGWACQADFWRDQVSAFADKARLLLVDLPGHGRSDKPQTEYSMDFFARAVVAVMQEAKADKATLVGHSMGAPVICRVYAQAPERVAALVAVDGFLRRPAMKPEDVEEFIGPYRTPRYRDQAREFIGAMFPNPETAPLRDQVVNEVLQTPQHVMFGAMEGMFSTMAPAWDLPKAGVPIPVLVLNTDNRMWSAAYQEYVRTLSPQAEYRTIPGAGHFVMLEKPAAFNAALSEMLEKFDLIGSTVSK